MWALLCNGSELLDLAGPWEVFGHANDVLGARAYSLVLVSPDGACVSTRHGLSVSSARPLPRRPRSFPDLLFVAGGSPHTPIPPGDVQLAAWLRRHHHNVGLIASVCTGAFILGEAGLLDGRNATTHWQHIDALRRRFPNASVVQDQIYVRHDTVWTSAGVTAGIDLALGVVEMHHGRDVAMDVARRLVLFLRRDGGQAQFSATLQRQQDAPDMLRGLESFVLENLADPLPVARLARHVAMSARSLTRWCSAHLRESPAAWVRRHRLEEARRLLETTELSLQEISTRTGLGDPSTLWRLFDAALGVTPATYRSRFGAMPGR